MNKKLMIVLLLIVIMISVSFFSKNYDNNRNNNNNNLNTEKKEGIGITFPIEIREEVFGDLTDEEVFRIIDSILDKIKKEEKYKANNNLAIENSLKEHGIDDKDKIKLLQDNLQIRN